MKPTRRINRRSFAATVLGGIVIGGGATALITGRARAQNTRYSGVNDSDTGEHADRPGYGVGTRSVYTDQDTGPNGDAQFHGRGPNGGEPGSPSGGGSYQVAPTGCSDSDSGGNADPGGRGRFCAGRPSSPHSDVPTVSHFCSDSDSGNNADPIGEGRRC